MKFQIDLRVHIETDPSGECVLLDVPTVHIVAIKADGELGPNHVVGPSEFKVEGNVDLLGKVPDKPKVKNKLDKSLTNLIDFFSNHESRRSKYVPTWPKDKKLLRPYLEAKGEARVREMLGAFVLRDTWGLDPVDDFNAKRILGAPLTIQAFVGIADCLDVLLKWETDEEPYSG